MNRFRPIRILVLLSYFVIISSCIKEHTREYTAINNSTDTIEVWLMINNFPIPQKTIIAPGKQHILHVENYKGGSYGVKDDRYEDSVELLTIFCKGAGLYITEDDWFYERITKNHGKWSIIYEG